MTSLPTVTDLGEFDALVIRTDYADEQQWQDLTAALIRPWDGPGEPSVRLVSDPVWAQATVEDVLAATDASSVIFLADHTSMQSDLHAVLAVTTATPAEFDFEDGEQAYADELAFGREFRIMADEVLSAHANLIIGNISFPDYAAAAAEDPSGVFQGY